MASPGLTLTRHGSFPQVLLPNSLSEEPAFSTSSRIYFKLLLIHTEQVVL